MGKRINHRNPMLLLCSFFRLKELFKVKNGLTTLLRFFFSFLFFSFFFSLLKIPNIWVGRTTLNGEIKGDGLNRMIKNV